MVGLILLLMSLNGFADYYKEKGIFNNALYSIIIFIIGIVIAIAVAIFILVDFLKSLGIDLADWQSLQYVDWANIMTPDKIIELIGSGILIFVVIFIFCVLGAIFLRKSLDMLATKTNVKLFNTTGLMFLLGAVLTIILIGFMLSYV